MGIKLDGTYAYFNNDKGGQGWHMVGLISGKTVREIISKRRRNGDVAGRDYRFTEER